MTLEYNSQCHRIARSCPNYLTETVNYLHLKEYPDLSVMARMNEFVHAVIRLYHLQCLLYVDTTFTGHYKVLYELGK